MQHLHFVSVIVKSLALAIMASTTAKFGVTGDTSIMHVTAAFHSNLSVQTINVEARVHAQAAPQVS